MQARGNERAGRGESRRRSFSEEARARKKDRRQESAVAARLVIGVDGEGSDKACGECPGCDPPDPDAPRTCKTCKKEFPRSSWPNRRCPDSECNASACFSPLHLYTYLCACDEDGVLVADAYNADGLSHNECCEMLLSLPPNSLCVGYMFSYDTTKIIEQMPASDRFYLMRPKLRETHLCEDCGLVFPRFTTFCPDCASESIKKKMQPLRWGPRAYDFFNGSLTIVEKVAAYDQERNRRVKIWDCFRFFGCAFVSALEDWKVGTAEQVERISKMKQKRGAFDVEDPAQVRAYCKEECHLLAVMMRRVIESHDSAGIPLKRYEGAGSTATALLKKFAVASYKGDNIKRLEERYPGLGRAIASAFFGGRFEDSCVGIVREPIHGFDISSAYPFALTHLPCLMCGGWREARFRDRETARSEIEKAGAAGGLALCRFRVRGMSEEDRKGLAWGPLPFRDDKGSIAYGVNFTGWAWGPEILAALRGWADLVEVEAAWIYETPCYDRPHDQHRPFDFLPAVYRERIKWGKEGAGKALKLGMNASYGKTAQSIGDDPPFQSWIWAGMTTAVTRGLLLDAIASAADRWNVLTVATDGIYAKERLRIWHRRTVDDKKRASCECTDADPETLSAPPRDTGTSDLPKPLGGWEHKELPEGVFVAKPGLYWKLSPPAKTVEEEKKQLADLRARGIGRRELMNRDEERKKTGKQLLEDGFLEWDRVDPKYGITLQSRRFYGAKHSVTGYAFCDACQRGWMGVPEQRCPKCMQCGTSFEARFVQDKFGKDAYGRWGARDVKISFDPYPKRERAGISREGTAPRLFVRDLGGAESAPYPVGALDPTTSPEGTKAREGRAFNEEQPDWDDERLDFADAIGMEGNLE